MARPAMPSRNKIKAAGVGEEMGSLQLILNLKNLTFLLCERSTQDQCPYHSVISILIANVY